MARVVSIKNMWIKNPTEKIPVAGTCDLEVLGVTIHKCAIIVTPDGLSLSLPYRRDPEGKKISIVSMSGEMYQSAKTGALKVYKLVKDKLEGKTEEKGTKKIELTSLRELNMTLKEKN